LAKAGLFLIINPRAKAHGNRIKLEQWVTNFTLTINEYEKFEVK